jgi:beta-mannanase
MTYTAMEDLRGLTGPYEGVGCVDAGAVDLPGLMSRFPRSVAQIGISMNGDLDLIKAGKDDDLIRNLGEVLRQTNKPIFLRIGYEFDGPWNHYDPELYVNAFRRIVSILRGETVNHRTIKPVNNVSFVWHSAAWLNSDNIAFEDWYPGDKYVDWVAVSWFGFSNAEETHTAELARARVLKFAQHHRKPVMIAESTPKEYFAPAKAKSWDGWYAKIFDWVAANNIKAFSYVNQDWNAQNMWRDPACKNGGDWGDSRIQKGDPSVLHHWQAAVEDPRFLKAGDQLFQAIGFIPEPASTQ